MVDESMAVRPIVFSDERAHVLISVRGDGSMRLGGSNVSDIEENRSRYFVQRGIDPARVVAARLAHGTDVARVGNSEAGQEIGAVDGLMTDVKNLYLSITVADCLPVYLFDPIHGAIALLHAGWRGLAGNIAAVAVARMAREFGTEPVAAEALIGPGIGPCHFDVHDDVAGRFTGYPGTLSSKSGRTYLDLGEVARQQLIRAGVPAGGIKRDSSCTFCDVGRYFSFRRDKPAEVEAMVAAIGITGL